MDREQEARWLAAQGIGVGADLVPAALRQLEFLAAVDRRRWLYEGPLLERAIQRYKTCWLPLLAKHAQATVVDGPLVVPLDCEWIWHCHRLNPVQYIKDCKRLYGRILDNSNVESSIRTNSKHQTQKVWTELYPEEPFDLEYTSPSDNLIYANVGAAGEISYDLVSAVKRQTSFCYQVGTPSMHDLRFLEEALARYKGFLYLIKKNQENKMKLFRVPTYDVDLMWHTHQLHPATYCDDMLKLLGRVLEHDDTDDDRSEGQKLDVGFSETTEQFQNAFGVRYWKAGAMYRGNMPSPVTSIPQIFSKEIDNDFDVTKAEKHLSVLETTVVELFLEIVDIKNLPPAIQNENVYIWFTKKQSDMFISDGGRLDISTKTGKSTGAGILCEPTGELILTVLVDQASSSKKPEPIGRVSISLQEFTQPDSKLSFERWLELKPHDGRACSPAVSLRVAASSTVPVKAQQVLSMIRTEPFFLKTFLLPPSIKDQKMSSWARFEYDCGMELIRLRIRDHKPKKDMAILRELVGVTKSSKKPFTLAEFKENKWSLSNSNLFIPADFKPSKDGSILELKIDNKLIKLYQGRRLEYGLKCCNHHAEDGSAVTAVKFSAEHPYGKEIALLDTDSELIMVNEDWFLLPWIVMSFLSLDTNGKDGTKLNLGAMVQKAPISETVKAAPAQCGTAFGGTIVPDGKTSHASCGDMAIASGTEADAKCGGCGSGCGGGCGPVVTVSSKEGHGIAVTGSGGNGHAEFAGCDSGCGGGVMVRECSKASNNCGSGVMTHESSKAGGCGSGCGGGCGGGVMVVESSMASGCGSGCGGGCGNMVNESSKAGGCGSGCGGGCGNMVNESSKASGCGSGCGGGCGNMVSESSKAGGCGSGCGGGCGNMVRESSKPCGCGSGCGGGCGGGVMVHESSKAKAGGCGSGCGGGCGNMVRESSKASGCGSGCGGGCGSGIMVHESSKAGGCGSGCGGGCGGGIMVRESSKAGGCGSACGGGCGNMVSESYNVGQAM